MFERILKYFQQKPITERRECKMQNFISFLIVLIVFENFEKFCFIVRRANPNYNKFEHFSWGGVDTQTIKI